MDSQQIKLCLKGVTVLLTSIQASIEDYKQLLHDRRGEFKDSEGCSSSCVRIYYNSCIYHFMQEYCNNKWYYSTQHLCHIITKWLRSQSDCMLRTYLRLYKEGEVEHINGLV